MMLIAGLLVALPAAALVALPWWWPAFAARRGLRRRAANVATWRTRRAELEAESAAGLLGGTGARAELDARLLADAPLGDERPAAAPAQDPRRSAGIALVLGVLLIAFAGTWYFGAGSWRTQALLELQATDPEAARIAALADLRQRLERRVEETPDDAEAWAWLGRLHRDQGRMEQAAAALGRANALGGDQDADLLAAEGEALLHGGGQSGATSPAERFERALALAPDQPVALWYSGLLALHAGDAARARERWERLAAQDLPEEARAALQDQLARLGGGRVPERAAAAPVELRVRVDLAAELAGEVAAGDTLYVFAQPVDGPRMPLAARRLPARLPQELVLSDADSPMPARKLSSQDAWLLVARVSKGGDAQAAAGDLQGERRISRQDAREPIVLTIDRKL